MIHLGDITKISGYEAPIVDCVIGGSPCQGLSVAGMRLGLDDERSGLFYHQVRIVKEMRENDLRLGRTGVAVRPRYLVWENVPGALSSGKPKGEDFRIVLEEIAHIADEDAVIPRPTDGKWTTSGCIMGDGWSVAWRICDAQFYGVPQRRRRIALVADFGGHSAQEILFVRNGLSRDTDQSLAQREAAPRNAADGVGADDRAYTVIDTERVVALDRASYNQGKNAQFDIGIDENGTAQSLVAKGPGAVCYGIVNGQADQTGLHEKVGTLNCMHDQQAVLVAAVDCRNDTESPVNGALQSRASNNIQSNNVVRQNYIVRRLTPLECERLQGFPDGWTDIGEWVDSKGKRHQASDAARYKALGNSIALPPWKWILKRLCAQYERDATMASLFSGVGGFDLLWTQLNGYGSVLWESEIDEFPSAVCRRHFGDEVAGEEGDFYEAILGRNKA